MGLLAEALREHLELKRKHGANPDDVARQEQEALGPSRRNAEFVAPSDAGEDVAAVQAPESADELPEGEPGIPEEPPAPEAPGYEEDPWLDEDRDEVPADEALQP